ncbi:MAG: S1 family peptidase [Candidatus Hydrogenedentes bacterium]|nr:S1 family peptidase [Candidatus Hydrogenedentota bacterium]
MQLESARDLKVELSQEILADLAEVVHARPLFGISARAWSVRPSPPSTLVLGVAMRGEEDFALAVRVQHRAMEASPEVKRIEKKAKGEVDVRYIGSVRKRTLPWHQQRQRPLSIGCSVGHFGITAGTLGAFVIPRGGGAVALLSNNHVLANENEAHRGDAILQPAKLDGGKKRTDTVALLDKFEKLKFKGSNYVDCATAMVRSGIEANLAKLTGLGKLKGVGNVFVDEGLRVAKIGHTTGLTRGRVTAIELDNVVVGYDNGDARFDNQIEIEGAGNEAFSDGGDSGSLIVGSDLRAVALLFAGSDQGGSNGKGLTYANPIHEVLDALKVDLAL